VVKQNLIDLLVCTCTLSGNEAATWITLHGLKQHLHFYSDPLRIHRFVDSDDYRYW